MESTADCLRSDFAGTAASWIHSTFYGGNIARGSFFAIMQSWGMRGVFEYVKNGLLVAGGVGIAAFEAKARNGTQG